MRCDKLVNDIDTLVLRLDSLGGTCIHDSGFFVSDLRFKLIIARLSCNFERKTDSIRFAFFMSRQIVSFPIYIISLLT